MPDVRERLQEIFRDVFSDETLVLTDAMTAADVDGWDSLAHINLIIAVERSLSVRFATAEISRMKDPGQNVGSFVALVQRKLEQR